MLNSNTYFLLRSRPGQTYPSQLTTYYLTIHLLVQTSGNVNPPAHALPAMSEVVWDLGTLEDAVIWGLRVGGGEIWASLRSRCWS